MMALHPSLCVFDSLCYRTGDVISIPSLRILRLFSVPVRLEATAVSCLMGVRHVLPHTVGPAS